MFIDETATKTNMARAYGRSPRGKRMIDPVPAGHWQTSTLIHAIDHQGTRAALLFEGATNTTVFETFVEKLLVPELRGDEIVILDNLSSHKGVRVQELIRSTGAELRFLPPYSPDLNPIEKIFSKLKAYLKSVAARTQSKLWDAVCKAMETIQPSDCQNCFKACGYRVT